eukprot:CAMPEP_0180325472 /NCGR_PEP_ID=MMETSP0988-20121125/38460_1 /TAXON_ID=697907 /ORGANISM="non described non described, Strain CCMP2293" /LENGTH=30 /DNA_ID= /DNA_START= /DNA_END= /DNA_ORIENTATION=
MIQETDTIHISKAANVDDETSAATVFRRRP